MHHVRGNTSPPWLPHRAEGIVRMADGRKISEVDQRPPSCAQLKSASANPTSHDRDDLNSGEVGEVDSAVGEKPVTNPPSGRRIDQVLGQC